MKVAEFMSSPVYTVSSERGVQFVSDMMNELKIGSLVVTDHGSIVGIITSRDIRSSHPNRIAADAMTPNPISISPDQFAWDALESMERHKEVAVSVFDPVRDDVVIGRVVKIDFTLRRVKMENGEETVSVRFADIVNVARA